MLAINNILTLKSDGAGLFFTVVAPLIVCMRKGGRSDSQSLVLPNGTIILD